MIEGEVRSQRMTVPLFTARTVDIDGLRWVEIREKLRPHFFKVWSILALFAGLTASGPAAIVLLGDSVLLSVFLTPVAALWTAFWLHAYTIHFHEAAHFHLAKTERLNDFLAWVFLVPFVGLAIGNYRSIHMRHHLHHGTLKDTEISYYSPITFARILSSASGWYLLTSVLRYFVNRNDKKLETTNKSEKRATRFIFALALALCTQAIIIFGLALVSLPASFVWVLSFFFFAPALNNLRQTLEHRSFTAAPDIDYRRTPHGAFNRMFGDDLFSKSFGAAGFNKHLLHHWDPTVSYTNLGAMEDFVRRSALNEQLESSRSTYFRAFSILFRWR